MRAFERTALTASAAAPASECVGSEENVCLTKENFSFAYSLFRR